MQQQILIQPTFYMSRTHENLVLVVGVIATSTIVVKKKMQNENRINNAER